MVVASPKFIKGGGGAILAGSLPSTMMMGGAAVKGGGGGEENSDANLIRIDHTNNTTNIGDVADEWMYAMSSSSNQHACGVYASANESLRAVMAGDIAAAKRHLAQFENAILASAGGGDQHENNNTNNNQHQTNTNNTTSTLANENGGGGGARRMSSLLKGGGGGNNTNKGFLFATAAANGVDMASLWVLERLAALISFQEWRHQQK